MPTRTFIRIPVHIDARITADDGSVAEGVVRDLSLNGLSIESPSEIPVGGGCAFALELGAGGDPVHIDGSGQIVRCGDGVIALTISAVDPEGFDHLNKLLLYNAPDAAAFEEQADEHADAHPTLEPHSTS